MKMKMNLKTLMNKPRIVGDDMKDKFSDMQEMLLLPLVMYYLHYSLGLRTTIRSEEIAVYLRWRHLHMRSTMSECQQWNTKVLKSGVSFRRKWWETGCTVLYTKTRVTTACTRSNFAMMKSDFKDGISAVKTVLLTHTLANYDPR